MDAAHTAAHRDMSLIVAMVGGAPGEEHRGVEFWVAVARNVCAAHGVRRLGHPEDAPVAPPPPRRPPRSRERLSDEDIVRLRLLADGLTVGEIAERLCHSPNTIKASLKKAYRVLGARNAAHAVFEATQRGVLGTPDGMGGWDPPLGS